MAFEEMKNTLLDFLFPSFCVSCDKPGAWWCEDCRAAVQRLSGSICPKCLNVSGQSQYAVAVGEGKSPSAPFVPPSLEATDGRGKGELDDLFNCNHCIPSLPFKTVNAYGYYHDPKLRSVITALKFNGATALLEDLSRFLSSRQIELPTVDAVVPMPLSEKRLRERGFNQAELIVGIVASSQSSHVPTSQKQPKNPSTLPWDVRRATCDVLFRVSHRDPQSTLEHDVNARRANVVGAFACRGTVPPRVLLVDDVVTTGATAGEAAGALLAAGAQEVHLLTLAIGA